MSENNTNYGIVYVLTNPAMPGLVKIGMTTRLEIDLRLRELYTTGVPFPFEKEYICMVSTEDCNKIERALHTAFAPYRVNPNREFFSIEANQAIAILKLLDKSTDITAEIEAETQDESTIVDRNAAENYKQKRRPPLNFIQMQIPLNSKLQFLGGVDDIEVEVCGEKRVRYENEEISLTALTKKLLELNYNVQPTSYWSYNGINLGDIYNDTYTTNEE